MNLIGENCISEKREDCFVRNYQQCFYGKGVNVKFAVALEATLFLVSLLHSFEEPQKNFAHYCMFPLLLFEMETK